MIDHRKDVNNKSNIIHMLDNGYFYDIFLS